jgi:3-oxoadipate enol-lactonase
LLWKRHRDLVSGLVLCATAPRLLFGRRERIAFTTGMAALAGTTRVGSLALAIPGLATRARPLTPPRGQRGGTPAWAAAEMRRHDLRTLVEAGHSLGTYDSRGWIHDVDVPTTVLVTERDRGVPASAQLELAARIPGATAITVADGHTACAKQSFVEPFLAACRQTAARVRSDR